MKIRRTVPDIKSDNPTKSIEFYQEFLGMEIPMRRDEIIVFASPSNPTAQINILKPLPEIPHPNISIEVEDVDAMYSKAKKQNIEIVYPITNEAWGVRRFFAKDPNGKIINILTHI